MERAPDRTRYQDMIISGLVGKQTEIAWAQKLCVGHQGAESEDLTIENTPQLQPGHRLTEKKSRGVNTPDRGTKKIQLDNLHN